MFINVYCCKGYLRPLRLIQNVMVIPFTQVSGLKKQESTGRFRSSAHSPCSPYSPPFILKKKAVTFILNLEKSFKNCSLYRYEHTHVYDK